MDLIHLSGHLSTYTHFCIIDLIQFFCHLKPQVNSHYMKCNEMQTHPITLYSAPIGIKYS